MAKRPQEPNPTEDQLTDGPNATSRRSFLKLGAGIGAAMAGGTVAGIAPATAIADDFNPSDSDLSVRKKKGPRRRSNEAYSIREAAADQHLSYTSQLGTQFDNDDELRYAGQNYYASFTKTLPSDEFGEVDSSAFEALQTAMRTGARADFDAIDLDPTATRTLANPQGAFRYEVAGLDSHATRMPPSHSFRSAELAGEMGEVYWQALTRDVPFSRYDIDPLIGAAVDDLNMNFSAKPGATIGGAVTSGTLFRGETPGDLIGPYISQFLWQDFSFGPVDVKQRYEAGLAGVDFMTDVASWLNVQRGGPTADLVFATPRYINNNRALAEYVHRDVLYQAYLHAALIILGYGGDAIDPGNPYVDEITNQGAFTSLGGPFVIDLVSTAGNLALSGAWFQKWRVHRLLRPEAYAGRVHFHMKGLRGYELNDDILNSGAVNQINSLNLSNGNDTYLLPMAYTEGSPTHPSYPAGHATVAGSCVTVLKAFFNEDFVIPNPVVSNDDGMALLGYTGPDLKIGGELNKVANNVAIGRDAAGVHYRQDGVEGLVVGEQQAIALLQDKSRTLNESNFDGFTLTKFDGTRINIKDGEVTEV